MLKRECKDSGLADFGLGFEVAWARLRPKRTLKPIFYTHSRVRKEISQC